MEDSILEYPSGMEKRNQLLLVKGAVTYSAYNYTIIITITLTQQSLSGLFCMLCVGLNLVEQLFFLQ